MLLKQTDLTRVAGLTTLPFPWPRSNVNKAGQPSRKELLSTRTCSSIASSVDAKHLKAPSKPNKQQLGCPPSTTTTIPSFRAESCHSFRAPRLAESLDASAANLLRRCHGNIAGTVCSSANSESNALLYATYSWMNRI